MNVYVIEDEILARQELIYLLHDTGQIKVIGEAGDIHQALWDINEKQPDAVFLDIELENGNGLDLAKQFKNMKKRPMVVFVTAYGEYALDAFELDAIDYIVKPIDKVRLLKAVDKLVNLKSTSHLENNVEVITGADHSCLMHLEGLINRNKQPLRVMHIAEILNSSI